jgi:two-component system sensor histidine kinase EvgS
VGNAIKFTYEGSIEINIYSSNFRNNKFDLQIDIKDTGIGIPKEQQNKIFESFVQKDGQSNRQYGGTGLGLSICLKLIKMMNGSIELKSKEGKGSIFSIILNDLKIIDRKKTIENIEKDEIYFEKSSILIVDDIELNRKLLIESLDNKNISFYEASNGKEAINIVKEKNPDLVLMDIKMPILNGIDATKILKNGKYNKIPIIALTASSKVKELHESSNIFDGFISKPINHNILIKELKSFLPYNLNLMESESYINTNILKIDDEIKDIFNLEFEKSIKQSWEKASQGCSFEDVLEFSNNLNEFTKVYKQSTLIEFIKNMNIAIENFDITSLESLILEFSRFLKEMKKETNND